MRTLLSAALLSLLVSTPALAANLKISTDPPGAAVQLDGVAYGPSPVFIPGVKRGTHELRVTAEGYTTRVDPIEVGDDDTIELHAPLNPAPKIVQPPPKPVTPPPPPPQIWHDPSAPPPQTYQAPPPPAGYQPPPPPAQTYQAPPPPSGYQPPPPPQTYQAPPAPYGTQPRVAPQTPLPVSQNPVAWGAQKKSYVLRVDTTPAGAFVQVKGLPDVKQSPAVFPGFSQGVLTVVVRATGYYDKEVKVEMNGDAQVQVVLDRAP